MLSVNNYYLCIRQLCQTTLKVSIVYVFYCYCNMKMDLKQAPLYKDHGYRSCISASFSLLTGNLKYIISNTWIYAVAFSVVVSLFAVMMPSPVTLPSVASEHPGKLVTLAFFPLFLFVAQLLFHSGITSLLTKRTLMWNVWRNFKAVISIAVLLFLLSAVLIASVLAVMKMCTPDSLTYYPVLAAVSVVMLFVLVLSVPATYSMMTYIMEPAVTLRRMMSKCYITGFRYWGYIFAVGLTVAVCQWFLGVVVSFPSLVLTWAGSISEYGIMLNGDEAGLPPYFVYMHFASLFVTTLISSYINIVIIFAAYYIYGSITRREELLEAQKAR